MIVKTLMDNTSISKDFDSESGLSLYIETKDYKILFDVGASGLFLENARKMGVAIADVNYLIISHGHNDHGGGLSAFLKQNTHAEVFLHRLAFEKYYARHSNGDAKYIGLEHTLKRHKQIVLTSDRFFIQKGVQVFSN
ncbi:MAG TPA: MBL fold hydrolase, partial [Ruminiclostridium sp.]|nr:MBL fold hydrolase [Ruminiclostridium sp.]